jgi:hypothetical protein
MVVQNEIIRNAQKNGIDPKQVVNDARRLVLTNLYTEFFFEMDRENQEGMDKIARSILRAEGGLRNVARSFRTRIKKGTLNPENFSPESLQMANDAFRAAWGTLPAPGSE